VRSPEIDRQTDKQTDKRQIGGEERRGEDVYTDTSYSFIHLAHILKHPVPLST
jgi:hypothetical protein